MAVIPIRDKTKIERMYYYLNRKDPNFLICSRICKKILSKFLIYCRIIHFCML
jgi:hypothetical protein